MQLITASGNKFEQSQSTVVSIILAQMGLNLHRWHLNDFGVEMQLITAWGNKFEQSQSTVESIGLSADGTELAQMAFK